MTSIRKAPMMQIRCARENANVSFQTTQTIPATLAALREYMQSHAKERPYTERELHSIKFRHRTRQQQEEDLRSEVSGVLGKSAWAGKWIVLYTTEEHWQEAERVAKLTSGKPSYRQTIFGYCDVYPVA